MTRFGRPQVLALVCIAVLFGILALGAAPFHAPGNQVTWIGVRPGIRLGDYGTLSSSRAFDASAMRDPAACSVEIWMRSNRRSDFNTFLAFYTPESAHRFSMHQSLSDLAVSTLAKSQHWTIPMLYVDHIFREGKPVFLTVTLSVHQAAIYLNGSLAKTSRDFPFQSGDCTGRLILGDSPLQPDSWSGQMLGLAIYDRALTPVEAARNYRRWMTEGRPAAAGEAGPVALYLFDEDAGDRVHDRAGGLDLDIPASYGVVDKAMLEPVWSEFHMTESYWIGNLKNVIGFIPLGVCFFAYFRFVRRSRHAVLATAILGAAASLTIEIFQAYLPTRDSGTTDLVTNTLGTVLGAMLHKSAAPRLIAVFPWLGFLYPIAETGAKTDAG